MKMVDKEKLMLVSIIYQLLNSGADIRGINPNILNYLEYLLEELDEIDDEETAFGIYYFADTYFNKINQNKKLLN